MKITIEKDALLGYLYNIKGLVDIVLESYNKKSPKVGRILTEEIKTSSMEVVENILELKEENEELTCLNDYLNNLCDIDGILNFLKEQMDKGII